MNSSHPVEQCQQPFESVEEALEALQKQVEARCEADIKAVQRFQVETGRAIVPPHEDLCVWLLGKLDRAEQALQACADIIGEPAWRKNLPAGAPPNTGDIAEDLPELIRLLQAELSLARVCPHCEEGDVYTGPSSVPGDEGFDTCLTCGGSGQLPNADRIREIIGQGMESHYEAEGLKIQLAEIQSEMDRLRPLSDAASAFNWETENGRIEVEPAQLANLVTAIEGYVRQELRGADGSQPTRSQACTHSTTDR